MNPLILSNQLSKFLTFLASEAAKGTESLPSLLQMSKDLDMSVSTLREELQVAKALGLVDVKPRTGIKFLPYSFSPPVSKSLAYAVSVDKNMFRQFSDLRNHIEASYWYQAVSSLMPGDVQELQNIIEEAQGILKSYWNIYEAVGLSFYEDRNYLERVWDYHQQMVESITQSDYLSGYQALIAHMDLLFQREKKNSKIPFE